MTHFISTIQDHIDFEYEVMAHCGRQSPPCSHAAKLDLKWLRKKLGPDYALTANSALTRSLVCRRCGHIGGEIRLSSAYLSEAAKRSALEEGMRERYVALPDEAHPGMWRVVDRSTGETYAAEEGPQDDLDRKDAIDLAEILNNPESFYAADV